MTCCSRNAPRIVVACQPPAGLEDLELVATERRRRSRLRVLHLAPPDAVEARLAALALGFDDSLTTAATGTELAGRLAWLEARARDRIGSTAATLPVADGLDLDLAAHELRRGTRTVHLRPKEYGLLAVLAVLAGRAYPVASCSSGSGVRATRAGRARWTSTCAGCARRSSPTPSGPSTSSRSGASATGWTRRSVNRSLTRRSRDVDGPARP